MSKEDKNHDVDPKEVDPIENHEVDPVAREQQGLEENAIDEDATHGKKINHQVKRKKNYHQPRDTA